MDDGIDVPPPPLPDMPEFSRTDMLKMEKETTGVYISGHPLDQYADVLSKLPVNSEMLATLQEDSPDGGMSWD